MSSPFQKLFSKKKAKLISLRAGMLVPESGSKLQKAIDNDNVGGVDGGGLSNREVRQANREYKRSVRKYNRKNDTNLDVK